MLSLLRNRNYRLLWLGQVISLVGDSIRDWAMLFYVFRASGENPVIQAFSFIAVILPSVVLAPFAGVLVDRMDRRKVMIASDVVRGLLSLGLVAAATTGQYWYAMGLAFAGACAGTFFNPARSTMIARTVGREHLMQANGLGQTTFTLAQLAGPALGTSIFVMLGPVTAFIADAATFFASALCIGLIRASGAVDPGKPKAGFFTDLRGGMAYTWQSRPIRALMTAFAVCFMGVGAVEALGIFLIRQVLGLPETAMVYPSTAIPAAMAVGSIALGSLAGRLKRPWLTVPTGLALTAVGSGLWVVAPGLGLIVGGSVLIGLGNALLNAGLATTLQTFVPDTMRGRVFGLMNALPMAAMVASSAAAGYMVQQFGARAMMGGSSLFILLAAGLAYTGLREVRAGDAAPREGMAPA